MGFPERPNVGVLYLDAISAMRGEREDVLRERSAREAPDAAKANAVARPMPPEAPVIRTTLPVNEPENLEGAMKG